MVRVVLLLFALLGACCAPQTPGQSDRSFVDSIEQRTHKLVRSCSDPTQGGHGTAVVLGPYKGGTILATANHVVAAPLSGICFFRLGEYRAMVVAQDPVHDVALIWIDKLERRPWVEESRPYRGQPIWAVGYPQSRLIEKPVLKVSPGFLLAEVGKWYEVSCPVYFGSSGGPAFDREGKLVGITSRLIELHPWAAPAELFLAPARHVFALVERL